MEEVDPLILGTSQARVIISNIEEEQTHFDFDEKLT